MQEKKNAPQKKGIYSNLHTNSKWPVGPSVMTFGAFQPSIITLKITNPGILPKLILYLTFGIQNFDSLNEIR